jgi:hypothetical protein
MMADEVYANGNEIAAKSGMNKVIAAFPDVCLSPPSPPAGPIPVPYPNSSFSKDLQEGSQTVTLGGQPAALAQQSYYKTSPLGDEAATRSFGANVVTHQITGKTYFQAWSFDVKIEGKNVCRHLDITTSNHASQPPGNPTPTPGTSKPAQGSSIPAGCPDPGICKFKDQPEPGPHKSLDDADNSMRAKAKGEPPTQQRGTVAEVRALRHNRKNKPQVKKGEDVECLWECTACNRKFEIDQVVLDDDDNVEGIVEVKSGGPLRSPQAGIHNALAQQKGIRSIKKVQHKDALKKCKANGLDHIDINPEPLVAL